MDVASILSVLADHGFSDTSTTRKVAIINDVVWDVCSREPWPFMEKSVSLTFGGSSAIPSNYPTDVASVLGIIDNINGTQLVPIRLEEFRSRHATDLSQFSNPYFYYFIGYVLYVFPIPTSTQTLLMSYIYYPTALTDSSVENAIAIPARFHSVIWYGVLTQLYDLEDDPELSERFRQKFEAKMQTMRNQLWLRQMDRPDTIEVTDPDDLYN